MLSQERQRIAAQLAELDVQEQALREKVRLPQTTKRCNLARAAPKMML